MLQAKLSKKEGLGKFLFEHLFFCLGVKVDRIDDLGKVGLRAFNLGLSRDVSWGASFGGLGLFWVEAVGLRVWVGHLLRVSGHLGSLRLPC